MKAVLLKKYGNSEDLEIGDVPCPVAQDHQVLVKVRAASVNDWDWSMVRGKPGYIRLICGLTKPKVRIPGVDVAGQVVEVGKDVKGLQVGDQVFGDLSMCGFGSFAEYVCAPESALTLKPIGMTFLEAASMPHAAALAYQGLHTLGGLKAGQSLLINGAGGGVGMLGVQMAAALGVEAAGVDSAAKADAMRRVGFVRTIDYRQQDFTKEGIAYDLILDTKTSRSPLRFPSALKPGGTYVTVGGTMGRLIQTLLLGRLIQQKTKKRVRILGLKPNEGMREVSALYAEGKIRPVVDRSYPLEEVPQAITHFGSANHIGKVVIDVCKGESTA